MQFSKSILQSFSRTQRENIFAQSTFDKKVWELVQTTMDMFEQGALKEQKLKKQQITAAPEFKQHLLQPLHHLKPDFQVNILTKI